MNAEAGTGTGSQPAESRRYFEASLERLAYT